MDSKRKLIVAIVAVVMLFLGAAIAVVAVIAAQNVVVNNGITINYNATGVIGAEVKAQYAVGTGTYSYVGSEAGIVFTGNEANESSTQLGNVEVSSLSAGEAYVTFLFTFKNTGESAFDATLVYEDSDNRDENMTISYISNAGEENEEELFVTVESIPESEDGKYVVDLGSLNVQSGEEKTYQIKIAVTAEANNAHFSGNFSWKLVAATETE